MTQPVDRHRRAAVKAVAAGLAAIPLVVVSARRAQATDDPLLKVDDPAARNLQYVEDATRAKNAKSGETCDTCSQYELADGVAQGHCTLFPGKLVKAAGWCTGWSSL